MHAFLQVQNKLQLEAVTNPIMSKLYGGAGAGDPSTCGQEAGGFGAGATGARPTVEEVD